MAKDVIDQLSLDIEVNVDKNIPKTISALASSIRKLNDAVANVSGLQKYMKNLSKISAPSANVLKQTAIGQIDGLQRTEIDINTQEAQEDVDKLKGELQELTDIQKRIMAQFEQSGKSAEESAKRFLEFENSEEFNNFGNLISKTTTIAEDGTERVVKKFEEINGTVRKVTTTVDGMRTSVEELQNPTKKTTGFWSKFVKSIGRIALYRAIRGAIKAITSAMQEGLNNYARYSDEANQSLSNIKNSFGQLKNTLGVTLGYALQSLEPIITAISDGLVKLIDNVNMALAAVSGKSTYSKAIKQNEDYAKSLDKVNSKLLSFDKFESLNKGDQQTDPSEMFEDVEVPKNLSGISELLQSVFGIVKEIFNLVKELWAVVEPILNLVVNYINIYIIPIVSSLIKAIISIIQYIKNVGTTFKGIVTIVRGLLKILTGDFSGAWTTIKKGFIQMLEGIVNAGISVINFFINAINAVLKPLFKTINKVGRWFGKDWDAGFKEIPLQNWSAYANGGTFEKGTAFIAGEAGAEVVYNSSRGTGGGVANIEQIRQAQYLATMDAIQDSGLLSALQNNGGDVYIDGRKAGQVLTKPVYNEGVRVGYFKRV